MSSHPRHDYHHCGCLACARIRNKKEQEKFTNPKRYAQRKELDRQSWTIMIFVFFFWFGIGTVYVFDGGWVGLGIFFLVWIITFLRWIYDEVKKMETEDELDS